MSKTTYISAGGADSRIRTLGPGAAIAAAVSLLLASAAIAAAPQPGGLYTGVLHAGGAKQITLKVSGSGKKATLVWYCDTGQRDHRSAGRAKVHIHAGKFHYEQYPGQRLGYSFHGRFLKGKRVRVHLQPYTSACTDEQGGTTVLTLSPHA